MAFVDVTFGTMKDVNIHSCVSKSNDQTSATAMSTIVVFTAMCCHSCCQRTYHAPNSRCFHTILLR